jgi:6-phosphogluconolactonase
MSERIVVDPPSRLSRTAADWVLVRLEESRSRGRFTIALAGGATPRLLYQSLATVLAHRVPWDRVEFYFGDERCVAPGDPESNFRMAEESLFRGHLVEETSIHRMRGEDLEPAHAAADYEALLPRSLDLLLLGVGRDGSIGSLFPGHPALEEKRRRVVALADAPRPPAGRLTITPPVIEAARAVLVVVSGPAKAEAVKQALEGPLDPRTCPAQLARRGTWILDRPASALLAPR